jgi:hypothetical protein
VRRLAVPSVIFAAGCGGGDSFDPDEAVRATLEERTARSEMTGSVGTPAGAAEFEMDDVVDFAGDRARLDVDMSDFARISEGNLGVPEDWRGEIVNVGPVTYLRIPSSGRRPASSSRPRRR